MDAKRKKDLLLQWKNRRPEMDLIAIACKSKCLEIFPQTHSLVLTGIGFSCQQIFIQTKDFRNYGINMVKMDLTIRLALLL